MAAALTMFAACHRAGMLNTLGVVCSGLYMLWTQRGGSGAVSSLASLRWRPSTHLQFWFAMLGGGMNFLHYFFFLKAFEGAPSTVLLPLVQVASVSVFLGSSVVALLRHEPWITPTHALAYLLMFIGGILPACAGNLSVLLERSFWRQNFVFFAIAAEFSLGLHDLMLSGCAYKSPAAVLSASAAADGGVAAAAGGMGSSEGMGSSIPKSEDSSESFEFFVWSRFSFIATFVTIYSVSPSLSQELRELLSGQIESKYVALSAISEGLTIVGFYLASIAYGLFYQAGIVHAAEASLSQLLNLMLAYLLLKCFGMGRTSAVSGMRIKFISFVMVTIGLFLCTFDADGGTKKPTDAAAPTSTTVSALPGAPSPAPYVSQTDLLLGGGLPVEGGVGTQMAATAAATAAQTAARYLRRRRRL